MFGKVKKLEESKRGTGPTMGSGRSKKKGGGDHLKDPLLGNPGKKIQVTEGSRPTRKPNYAPPLPPSQETQPLGTEGNDGPNGPETLDPSRISRINPFRNKLFKYTEDLMVVQGVGAVKSGAKDMLMPAFNGLAQELSDTPAAGAAQALTDLPNRILNSANAAPASKALIKANEQLAKAKTEADKTWHKFGETKNLDGIMAKIRYKNGQAATAKVEKLKLEVEQLMQEYEQALAKSGPNFDQYENDFRTVDTFVGDGGLGVSLSALRSATLSGLRDPKAKLNNELSGNWVAPELQEMVSNTASREMTRDLVHTKKDAHLQQEKVFGKLAQQKKN
jgi:hypothetical protein